MIETIGVLFGGLALWLAWKTFKGDKVNDLKELRKITLEKLDFLDRSNASLAKELYEYGIKTDGFANIFDSGLTLQQCLQILQDVREQLLTKESYDTLISAKSKMRLAEIKEGIEIQTKHHAEIRTRFELFIKPALGY